MRQQICKVYTDEAYYLEKQNKKNTPPVGTSPTSGVFSILFMTLNRVGEINL